MTKITIAFICMMPLLSYAQSERCQNPNLVLNCKTEFSLKNNTRVAGPQASAQIEDRQPEPFDLPACAAGLALNTPEGKLVADYYESDSTIRVWIETLEKYKVLAESLTLTNNVAVLNFAANQKGDIRDITLICEVVK